MAFNGTTILCTARQQSLLSGDWVQIVDPLYTVCKSLDLSDPQFLTFKIKRSLVVC